ncbi:hypothetical protein [Oceanithermus desulfurans]|nr:hypothetical protein [Oceanithermus desulfurans]MBB6028801.1 hypothetical protein [Oceanithermus desulfurans]
MRLRFWSYPGILMLLLLSAACTAGRPAPGPGDAPPGSGGPTLAGCPVFPADHVWNTPVDDLPVHPDSAAYIASIGPDTGLHPDFGAGLWEGEPIGIPFNLVDAVTPRVPVAFLYDDESDPGPYPIPADPRIEGGSDRHLLALDTTSCTLYELYAVEQGTAGWSAGSGAVFDLRGYALRPDGWTSADAAGLPILPGLVRYDEVAAGEIRHALRFTASRTQRAYVWPARHYASSRTDPDLPPMGLRLRLRADFDTSGFSPEVQVLLEALKKYGMILADNGADGFISGVPDDRWDNDTLVTELRRVKVSDFEAVDTRPLMLDPDSGRARQP